MQWFGKKSGAILGLAGAAAIGVVAVNPGSARAATEAEMERAKEWLDEFQPSTLSREEQLAELEWFIDAAKEFKGMDIQVVSETIATHEYEANTLAKAFSDITGINLTHDLIQEGDVIEILGARVNGYNGDPTLAADSDTIIRVEERGDGRSPDGTVDTQTEYDTTSAASQSYPHMVVSGTGATFKTDCW